MRFRDSVKGPFSPDELLLISTAVSQGQGADQDRAIVMLHLELGHNPNASARLRNKDFVRYETKSAVAYQVEVLRVKKRTSRRETKSRPISAALGSSARQSRERLLHVHHGRIAPVTRLRGCRGMR